MKSLKKLIFIVFIIMLVSSCEVLNDAGEDNTSDGGSSEEISETTQYWDWTKKLKTDGSPETYTLYVENSFVGQIEYVDKQLPYFSSDGGPASNDLIQSKDVMPRDGWVLIKKDFGESTPAYKRYVSMPHFILYNRTSGKLRVIYFNTLPGTYTYGKAVLSCNPAAGSGKAAMFTAFKTFNAAVDNYDSDPNGWGNMVSLHKIAPTKWCYADFMLSFDPTIESGNHLKFELWGIRESDITLNGSINFKEVFENRTVNVGLLENIQNSFSAAGGYYNNAKTGLGVLITGFNWLDGVVNSAAVPSVNVTDGNYAPSPGAGANASLDPITTTSGIIAAAGFLYNFANGWTKNQAVSLGFFGSINLSGKIVAEEYLDSSIFKMPGFESFSSDDATDPVFNEPLGIIGFLETPVFKYHEVYLYYVNTGIGIWKYYNFFGGISDPIDLKINITALNKKEKYFNYETGKYETVYFTLDLIETGYVRRPIEGESELSENHFAYDASKCEFLPLDEFFEKNNYETGELFLLKKECTINLFESIWELENYNSNIRRERNQLYIGLHLIIKRHILDENGNEITVETESDEYGFEYGNQIEIIKTIAPVFEKQ